MDIKILNKKTELADINAWLPFKVTAEELPGHTFCALYNGKIIAIAGLRLAEGPMCILDSMASDQSAPAEIRNEALDEISQTIFKKAKELGFKSIMACTREECILKRADKHGLSVSDQKIISKEL